MKKNIFYLIKLVKKHRLTFALVLCCFAVGGILSLVFFTKAAVSWQIENIDSGSGAGLYASMEQDSVGNLYVAYFSSSSSCSTSIQCIKFAKKTGNNSWAITELETSSRNPNSISLALDTTGNPHLAFLTTESRIKYMESLDGGNSWGVSEILFPEVVNPYYDSISLTIGSDSTPYLSYIYADNSSGSMRSLKFAKKSGSLWAEETVYTQDFMSSTNGTSIALDPNGMFGISFSCGDSIRLCYTKFDGSSWQTQTLLDNNLTGLNSSLKFDTLGFPHISHMNANGYLRYSSFDGTNWINVTVEGNIKGGNLSYTDLLLDNQNQPHIAYQKTNSAAPKLKYAYRDNSGWHKENVAPIDYYNNYELSIVLGIDGLVKIAYYDSVSLNLKLASQVLPPIAPSLSPSPLSSGPQEAVSQLINDLKSHNNPAVLNMFSGEAKAVFAGQSGLDSYLNGTFAGDTTGNVTFLRDVTTFHFVSEDTHGNKSVITGTLDSQSTTKPIRIYLVYEAGAWKILSIKIG